MPSPDPRTTHTFAFSPAELADLTAAVEIARVGASDAEADVLGDVYVLLLTAEQTAEPVVVSADGLTVLTAAVEVARAEAAADADERLLPVYRKLLAAQIS